MIGENFKNLNSFIIFFVIFFIIFIFKYCSLVDPTNDFIDSEIRQKFLNKNSFHHVFFVPDTYHFIKSKKLHNTYDPYMLFLKKILIILNECLVNSIPFISIELFSKYDFELMNYQEIEELIDNQSFWNFLIQYAKKMNIQINFFYSKNIPISLKNKLEYVLRSNTHEGRSLSQLNILIGFDFYESLENKIIDFINKEENYRQLILKKEIQKIDIKEIVDEMFDPIDIFFVFENASLSQFALLNFNNYNIIRLNYSLETINKKIISLMIKKYLFFV